MAGKQKVTCKEAVLHFLRGHGGHEFTPSSIARAVSFGVSTVHRALASLSKEGKVECGSTLGTWAATDVAQVTHFDESELGLDQGVWTLKDGKSAWRDLAPVVRDVPQQAPFVADGFTVVHYETLNEVEATEFNALEMAERLTKLENALTVLGAEKLRLRTFLQGFKR